ncbi:ARM repeat-containing protein [Hypoxylon crocopeplum]|nr:ARM repeat-containing protein [Hypoxylon crocopeplum]
MTLDEIEGLLQNAPEDEESRTETLRQILGAAQESDSPELESLAEKVGNASREESWRMPLGKSGLLDFFLNLIKRDELDSDLTVHTLRVIGNSCADQDENRQRVVDSGSMPRIVTMLGRDFVLKFAIPVLFNICVDYEPAQVAAYKARLAIYLVNLLMDPRLQEQASVYMNIVYKLLGLVATQEFEPGLVVPQTPFCLLSLANQEASNPDSADLETFLGLSTAALAYLSYQQLQESFLETPDAINVFLETFRRATEGSLISQVDEEEEQALLKQLPSTFTQTLADLSANPRFVSLCPLDGKLASLLLDWISSPHHASLQTAACLALGNLARSDASSINLVQKMSVHRSLITILSNSSPATDAQLLHSTLSFLKNLAIPASNKAVQGDARILDSNILPRIWNLDTQPQIQFDAVSLARLLLVNCPENVRRVCVPLTAQDPAPLDQLMDLHRKADQEPIKMETARSVANVCRVLHSSSPIGSSLVPESSTSLSSEEESPSLLQDFYDKHPTLSDTLLYLGLQSKFPVLRSELWFVLALMARSAEGSAVVTRAIQQHPLITDVLVEAITGEKVPEQSADSAPPEAPGLDISTIGGLGQLEPQQVDPTKAATMTKVDRENGLVLIAELLKRCPDELSPTARNMFVQILKAGGELVLGDRNEE